MRVIMRAGTQFEEWACAHIEFEALDHCWPYLLEERFGEACVALKDVTSLDEFCEKDCLAVALRLRLPVKAAGALPIPVDLSAGNPISESEFRQFRIQTMREYGDGNIEPFTSVDDPFDEKFGPPFFGFYGVCNDGLLEHIADFKTYADAVGLARKLAPGIQFPDMPHSRFSAPFPCNPNNFQNPTSSAHGAPSPTPSPACIPMATKTPGAAGRAC